MDDLVQQWIDVTVFDGLVTSKQAAEAFNLWLESKHLGEVKVTPNGITWAFKRMRLKSIGRYPRRWIMRWPTHQEI